MKDDPTIDTMNSSSGILNKLAKKNYAEFRFNGQKLSFDQIHSYRADELTILRIYRFEGMSNPDDEEVIYVLNTAEGMKGYFHLAYGTYADESIELANFLRQVPEARNE